MPTRRLPDDPGTSYSRACTSNDHNPSLLALEPGRYEHRCSRCGEVTVFDVGAVSRLPGEPTLEVRRLEKDAFTRQLQELSSRGARPPREPLLVQVPTLLSLLRDHFADSSRGHPAPSEP